MAPLAGAAAEERGAGAQEGASESGSQAPSLSALGGAALAPPGPENAERFAWIEARERRRLARRLLGAASIAHARDARACARCEFPVALSSRLAWEERTRSGPADGVRTAALEALWARCRELVEAPCSRWPSAVVLATWALEAWSSESVRTALAFAHLGAGDVEIARQLLEAQLRAGVAPGRRGRVLEGLAIAHTLTGQGTLARLAIEAAAEAPVATVGALVEALALALCGGDPGAVRRAAARLELLVDPTAPALASAIERLRRRRVEGELALGLGGERGLLLGLLDGDSSAARVARALGGA